MPDIQLDALVVGTGFSGIYQLYSLLKLGLKCRAIDMAGDIGGVWYWNRYPGAMSDSPSVVYRYPFDQEELRTYPWPNNYVTQQEILEYMRHFVDKHGLRDHMQFKAELISAEWNEGRKRWFARVSNGQVFVVRYLITALGQMNKKNVPDIPGIHRKDLQVKVVHSSSWDAKLDIRGKRKKKLLTIFTILQGHSKIHLWGELTMLQASESLETAHPVYRSCRKSLTKLASCTASSDILSIPFLRAFDRSHLESGTRSMKTMKESGMNAGNQ